MFTIDLNCDLGESFGSYVIGNDEAMSAISCLVS
ncbi:MULTISPECIES: LamB/YcsF family protein [Priestia]|nr:MULTISPECIES: LamB/YcsF family protein [Priestia]MED3822380.1 LamB/YcsF family protein [Priestia flexa]MED4589532.1 LamB/YcsF family protein [Priestia flexa]